jgi:hypothetical protein
MAESRYGLWIALIVGAIPAIICTIYLAVRLLPDQREANAAIKTTCKFTSYSTQFTDCCVKSECACANCPSGETNCGNINDSDYLNTHDLHVETKCCNAKSRCCVKEEIIYLDRTPTVICEEWGTYECDVNCGRDGAAAFWYVREHDGESMRHDVNCDCAVGTWRDEDVGCVNDAIARYGCGVDNKCTGEINCWIDNGETKFAEPKADEGAIVLCIMFMSAGWLSVLIGGVGLIVRYVQDRRRKSDDYVEHRDETANL